MRGCRTGATFLFKLYKGSRDYPGDGVGARKGDERAGDFSHDANGATAVDEVYAMLVEGFAEGFGGGNMGWRGTRGGAAAVFVLVSGRD